MRAPPGIGAGRRSVILGCAETRGGHELRLYAWGDAAGPCLYLAGLPGGTRGCGRAPSERLPPSGAAIGGPAIARRPAGAPLELYGETGPAVHRVVLRYRLREKRRGRREAVLIRVRARAALAAAGIRRPFGYFVGMVPRKARQVVAEAQDHSGGTLGRLEFDRIVSSMHPTVFIAIGR